MKRLIFYIIPLLSILTFSCKDEMYNYGKSGEDEGTMLLSVALDIPQSRTRAIDMSPGAAVYLNKIWVGIYRKSDGKRVGGTDLKNQINLSNRLTESGVPIYNLIPVIGYDEPVNSEEEVCVVAIANYDGIYSNKIKPSTDEQTENATEYYTLFEELKNADSWSKFIDISINTRQNLPYATPLLMGYLTQSDNLTMVDQFGYDDINISGNTDIFIGVNIDENGKLTSLKKEKNSNWLLRLRRLRSKININIDPGNGISITNLEYKVFNVPNSSFLAERKTNDMTIETGPEYSPNSSDRNNEEYEDGYYDIEWINPQDNYNFSFEHFENKHWAKNRENLNDYHKREAHSGDPLAGKNDYEEKNPAVFSVLANSKDDWNNNASYMVIRMSIRDENKGRNADVDYIVHEGFINNQDGIETDDMETRLKDFSCIRNTDYIYNIRVNGVNDIVTTVSFSNDYPHLTDQYGKVWEMDYAKSESPKNHVIVTADPIKVKKSIKFQEDADLAFRLVGSVYDKDNKTLNPIDICYNFARGELDGFANVWKAPSSETTQYLVSMGTGTDNYKSSVTVMNEYFSNNSSNTYLNTLLDGIKIKVNENDYKTITEYINDVQNPDNSSEIEGFIYNNTLNYPNPEKMEDVEEAKIYMRGLYIFDRNEAINGKFKDEDGCVIYRIYAAEQYPDYDDRFKVTFDESCLIWDYEYSNLLTTNTYNRYSYNDNVVDNRNKINESSAVNYYKNHWFGGRETTTEMHWKHLPGVTGYKIQIRDFSTNDIKTGTYEQLVIKDTEKRFNSYIEDINGQKIFHCPFTTTRYSVGAYNVIITPFVDANIVKNNPEPIEFEKALIIQEDQIRDTSNGNKQVTLWNFSEIPWKTLSSDFFDIDRNKPIEYNGLLIYHKENRTNEKFPVSNNGYIKFDPSVTNVDKDNLDNCFVLYLHEPGILKVTVTSNGGEKKDRDIYVYDAGNDKETKISEGTLDNNKKVFEYKVVPPSKNKLDQNDNNECPYIPSKYYIYCKFNENADSNKPGKYSDCFFYEIRFERNR